MLPTRLLRVSTDLPRMRTQTVALARALHMKIRKHNSEIRPLSTPEIYTELTTHLRVEIVSENSVAYQLGALTSFCCEIVPPSWPRSQTMLNEALCNASDAGA